MSLDPESVRAWKAGLEAANQVTLEEIRRRTPAERWAIHLAFLSRLQAMGKAPDPNRDLEDHLLWGRIQQEYLAKQNRAN